MNRSALMVLSGMSILVTTVIAALGGLGEVDTLDTYMFGMLGGIALCVVLWGLLGEGVSRG